MSPRLGQPHRPEAKGNAGTISEGTRRGLAGKRRREEYEAELARLRAQIGIVEVREYERTGATPESWRPYAIDAEIEAAGFIAALGGDPSEQRIALIHDLARAGVLVRALIARTLQSNAIDLEIVAKISTLLGVRRQGLIALGLDRVERAALDLSVYLERREQKPAAGVGATNGAGPSVGNEHTACRGQEDEA
jgi:hypothetical protein